MTIGVTLDPAIEPDAVLDFAPVIYSCNIVNLP